LYAHSESNKKATLVASFGDIVDVQLPQADRGDNVSECSKASKVSMFRRISAVGFGKPKEGEDQHVLKVLIRPAKLMELECSNASEALNWFEAFNSAIALARSTMAEDGEATVVGADEEVQQHETSGWMAEGPAARITSPAAAAAEIGSEDADFPPTPPTRGTFMDFNMDPDPEEPTAAAAAPVGPAAAVSAPHLRTAPQAAVDDGATPVVSAGVFALQAADFGFGDGEDGDNSSCSSRSSSPREIAEIGAAADGADGEPRVERPPPPAGADAAQGEPSGRGGSYGDKDQGLTMQERLANLEFSDDEGDDDDPLGLKAGPG